MGMYDDIIIPKSYLRGLLTKKQERLLKSNEYQTKSLENLLSAHKLHRQKLFIQEKNSWVKTSYTGLVNFYNSFSDEDGNRWWVEFDFDFVNGVLDKKALVSFQQEASAAEVLKQEDRAKWEAERNALERTFKYKFFNKLFSILNRLTYWLLDQTKPNRSRAIKQEKKRTKPSFWKDF